MKMLLIFTILLSNSLSANIFSLEDAALKNAVLSKDIAAAKNAIENGADLNKKFVILLDDFPGKFMDFRCEGYENDVYIHTNPLITAIEFGDTKMIELLIDSGAQTDYFVDDVYKCDFDKSPLSIAILRGDFNLADKLIDLGVSYYPFKGHISSVYFDNPNPFLYALSRGIHPNDTCYRDSGWSLLSLAFYYNAENIYSAILNKGGNPNLQCKLIKSYTGNPYEEITYPAYFQAIHNNNLQLLKELQRNYNIDFSLRNSFYNDKNNKFTMGVFGFAVKNKVSIEMLEYLVEQNGIPSNGQVEYGRNFWFHLTLRSDLNTLKYFSSYYDVNKKIVGDDLKQRTVLPYLMGYYPHKHFADYLDLVKVEFLLTKGLKIDLFPKRSSPVITALEFCHVQRLELLKKFKKQIVGDLKNIISEYNFKTIAIECPNGAKVVKEMGVIPDSWTWQ